MIERVVFMGTPYFAVPALVALASKYPVVGVYTQPDRPVGRGLELALSPVKKRAIQLGLPVFQPEKLSAPGEIERLSALKPDLVVVAAYGQILRQNILELPRLGCINIHSSLLPRWRGAAPIHWAVLSGDFETGVTTMLMNAGLDTGPMLLQSKTPIRADETAQSLHDRLSEMGSELLLQTVEKLDQGSLTPQSQPEVGVTYAQKLTKDLGLLWSEESAVTLERKVRALNPWPGTWISTLSLGRLKILAAEPLNEISGAAVGQIFEKNGMILLRTIAGCLHLKRMQWEGKSPIGPVEFLNGLKGRGLSLPLQISSKPQ